MNTGEGSETFIPAPYLSLLSMPHATNDDSMADVDEAAAIRNYLQGDGADISFDHEIDQGDKSDNAIDYEDFSDDELPEEEEATQAVNDGVDDAAFFDQMSTALGGDHAVQAPTNGFHHERESEPQLNGNHAGDASDLHDLFGDDRSSSPVHHRTHSADFSQPTQSRPGLALPGKSSLALPRAGAGGFQSQPTYTRQQRSPVASSPPLSVQDEYSPAASGFGDGAAKLEDEADLDPQVAEQLRLFEYSRRKQNGEDVKDVAIEVDVDEFYNVFSGFDPSRNPDFIDLFAPRTIQYRRKAPIKPPKPVMPTKVSLELLPDQERLFKTHKAAESTQRDGIVYIGQGHAASDESDDDLALSEFDEHERIGGVTAQDLILLCEDWDIPSMDSTAAARGLDEIADGDWDLKEQNRPRKKARVSVLDTDLSMSLQAPELSFEEPERATARLAKSIALDMNDPNLLIDEVESQQKRRTGRSDGESKRDQTTARNLAKRYNISNDEAYDLLKENHQHKVRSTIGSNAAEHSLPAARLQYPFYKVHLDNKQKRAFHRPHLDIRDTFKRELKFSRPKYTKRKHIKGKKTQEIFQKAEDLSIGDNSNLLLLEYSEEAPFMMSNFGMGNRLVNYYRKKSSDDNERPKRDVGDTQVLLPQDKSPFSNFGHVDSGEVVPTIQNSMYRAPVFAHKTKQTDFVVGVSSTYMSGHRLFIRNVENLHIVGQQFPVAEVPTEHSRKVTNAAKHRLRTIAFRILRKSQMPMPGQKRKALTNESLMPHLPGHDMPQLRSKMREFMKYERSAGKDAAGVWTVGQGQQIPDEETLRGWITPTDICLLDSMQVGVQHLADLGYSSRGKDLQKEEEDVEEGANIEIQLAPWHATRTFLAATQSKAMLALHGEGDPTGRGEALSFVKTSMKGGFSAHGESAQDKIQAKKRRETGGHSYNVAQQQKAYDDSIRRIWEKQKESLSNNAEMSDFEPDDEPDMPQSAYPGGRAATPRSSIGTPAAFSRQDDESASQFSRGSASRGDKVLTIARATKDKFGNDATEYEKVTNPRVINLYRKRKMEQDLMQARSAFPIDPPHASIMTDIHIHSFLDYKPTGDTELDNLKKQQIEKELERIKRNADRRTAREKQKGRVAASTAGPGSPGAPSDADGSNADGTPQKTSGRGRNKDGTARKCANCGQVGHIKTNRKSVHFQCSFCLSDSFDPTPVATAKQGRRDSVQDGADRNVNAVLSGGGSGSVALSTFSAFQL